MATTANTVNLERAAQARLPGARQARSERRLATLLLLPAVGFLLLMTIFPTIYSL
jgi:hypothetical protein